MAEPTVRKLKVRCLMVDFDDTVVDSTTTIHHPAYVAGLKRLRPDLEPLSLEGWFKMNHAPGVSAYLESIYNEEQQKVEFKMWTDVLAKSAIPEFYPEIVKILQEFKASGGFLAIVSHNQVDYIERAFNEEGKGVVPDCIFGWHADKEKRKPALWPAQEIMRLAKVGPEDCLMLDDLTPGLKMAEGASIPYCVAAWQHDTIVNEVDAKTPILRDISDLRALLFDL
eukprot:GEMP01044181.1.p1 GENE.GEMP01044181.1~~GEMP01044181.1.p1  ORF type:complete len:225 (+),score=35.93 GEMP01044181.1:72-746(+)